MIGISKLYCGTIEPSDPLRYGRHSSSLPSHLLQFSSDAKPVIVWNITQRCNLRCIHCYAHADTRCNERELTADQGLRLLDELADFGVPVVLFSGGEPLMRDDLPTLIAHARRRNMRAVISTNGTLIDNDVAKRLADLGLSYVGVSIDGLRKTHDRFRGADGAFDLAMRGVTACQSANLKVGLRFTLSQHNVADLPGVFDILQKNGIPRICIYHLVYTGRAGTRIDDDLSHAQTRSIVDLIIDRAAALHAAGQTTEVLTVDNHCDGIYLYLRMKRERSPRADDVMKLLEMNGGNRSGIGIGSINWTGDVYADQFSRHRSFGNILERSFRDIWTQHSDPILAGLKNRKPLLVGRCATCRWLNVCNGNLRLRAEVATGNVWACDPACYLTDAEIDPHTSLPS